MSAGTAAALPRMIGTHPSMVAVYDLVRRVAPTELPVVVVGATGTGKELVANAIHHLSPRRDGPLIDLNCAAVPEALVESELFGWEQGAFTGAVRATPGLLEAASGGTLFLDEACSLPLGAQNKLLRALEQRAHRRVGGRKLLPSSFRLVLAVQEPLFRLVEAGRFNLAFAHRVAGVTVALPPLAERASDIALLADRFLADAAASCGRPLSWSDDALATLGRMRWSGNVRELKALVARLPIYARGGVVQVADVLASADVVATHAASPELTRAAVAECGGSVSAAARRLGVPRSTLRDRLART